MRNVIEISAFGLFGLWFFLIPSIMIMKIKYFKRLKGKELKGTADLFSFLSTEWWIAGLTWCIPIIGQHKDIELNQIRSSANSRIYILYFVLLTQLILVALLNKLGWSDSACKSSGCLKIVKNLCPSTERYIMRESNCICLGVVSWIIWMSKL